MLMVPGNDYFGKGPATVHIEKVTVKSDGQGLFADALFLGYGVQIFDIPHLRSEIHLRWVARLLGVAPASGHPPMSFGKILTLGGESLCCGHPLKVPAPLLY